MRFLNRCLQRLLPLSLLMLLGCAPAHPPLRMEPKVDLARFMGPWYVIASIPTFIEKEAYNAIERYDLEADGSIATTFTFREGGFQGPEKRYTPRGHVKDTVSNAVWDMVFFWPFPSDFRIVYVSPDYSTTIIGREARDFVWIMARTPELAPATLNDLIDLVVQQGYDRNSLRLVPQHW